MAARLLRSVTREDRRKDWAGPIDTRPARVFDPPMLLRTLCLLLLMLPVWGAHAQVRLAPAPAVPLPPAAAALSPAEAQRVLDVLQDDKKRAEFTTTLQSMARAAQAVAPATTEGLPLAPGSLGAELLVEISAAFTEAEQQIGATVGSVNDLPLLQRWLMNQATDPAAQARMLDAGWKLIVVALLGLGAEWLVVRATRGLWRRLAAAAPGPEPDLGQANVDEVGDARANLAQDDQAPSTPAEEGDTDLRVRRHRLTRAFRTLQRLPFVLGRLMLDLLPVAAAIVAADIALGTTLGEPAITRLVILAVVRAYVICRVVLCVMHMIVSPAYPSLRLLSVSDRMAAFLARWTQVISIIGVFGSALAAIGLLFGMYNVAHDSLLKLFGLVIHICLVIAVLQCRRAVARHLRAPKRSTGAMAVLRNRLAASWHVGAIFYIMALWVVWAIELRDGYTRLLHFFIVTTAVLLTARLASILILGGLDRALRLAPEMSARYPGLEERAGLYNHLLRQALSAAILAITAFALLIVWGFHPQYWFEAGQLGARSLSAVVLISVTLILAAVAWEGSNAAVERHLARLTKSAQLARSARLRTLLPMLRTALLIAILLIVALTVLSEIGVNIAPLLAGAGVIGIAVGFGSQKLVQDLITGLFLLLENAMQVGDVVTLGGLTGTVETLSVRTIRLRALDGSLHIIPFSAVTTVTNQTRDYSYALVDVSVGLNEDPDRIADVLRSISAEMRGEALWRSALSDDLDVMGIEKFIDLAWVLRVRIKTLPASRWAVSRELNRRIKLKFDELAIESPFTSFRVLSAVAAPAPGAPPAAINPPFKEQAA